MICPDPVLRRVVVLGVPDLAAIVTVLVLAPAWPACPATVMVMGLVAACVVVVPPTPPDDTTIIFTPPLADTYNTSMFK